MSDQSPNAIKELENAFQAFNQLSDHLSSSYQALEDRIHSLNQELASARSERLEQLQEKERLANRLSQLLTALPAGVIVIDGAGRIQESNRAAVDLLAEPLQGELWRDIIQRAFDGDQGQDARLKDGRLVNITTCPLGEEPGQIVLLMDVTEHRALQDALERHKRLSAMGEVAAKLAHQVRTPLASAILYGSQLNRERLPEADRSQYVGKLMGRLRHLEHVVEDMLTFTRGGAGGQECMVLSDLLDELYQGVEAQLQQADCRLSVDDEAPGYTLQGNRDALQGVLQNLVTNAIQACGAGGRFHLAVRPVAVDQGLPAVDLLFSDNGPGIPADVRERIFEPFFTTRSQGTGLGLAVVQAVIQAHGGTVWLESEPGAGTTFGLRLPSEPAQPHAEPSEFVELKRSAV